MNRTLHNQQQGKMEADLPVRNGLADASSGAGVLMLREGIGDRATA